MSATSMHTEEFWRIVEGFVELHGNLKVGIKMFGRYVPENRKNNLQ